MAAKHILFIDDEECIAESFAELLEDQGFAVTSATNSLKALDIFRTGPYRFDLVFTDLTMPEMSGMELVAKLRQIRPDIPIVLCSGFEFDLSEAEAQATGIRAICMKPLRIEQLSELAEKIIGSEGS